MRAVIIGAGSTALACAAHFQIKGITYRLYARDEEKAKLWKSVPLTVSGEAETSFYVPVTSSPAEAMRFSDRVFVFTGTEDYGQVTEDLRPYLRDAHHILFMNGGWGLVKSLRILLNDKDAPEVSVGETSEMPFAAALSEDRTHLYFRGRKDVLGYASFGGEEIFSEMLREIVPRVSRASSPAMTSLCSALPIVRTAGCLFNMTRIENGEDFDFFGTGLTRRAADFMEACDRERLEIAKALGAGAVPLLSELNVLKGLKAENLWEALRGAFSGQDHPGPKQSPGHFLTGDLTCALEGLCNLSDMMHVEVPYLRQLTDTMHLYLGWKRTPCLTARDLWILKHWKR